MRKLRIVGDYILIKPDAQEEAIGSFVIPTAARARVETGMVVQLGSGRVIDEELNLTAPYSVEVGDRVLYHPFAGSSIVEDGETLLFLLEDDIIAVIYVEDKTCK